MGHITNNVAYAVALQPDDGTFLVTCRDLPEVTTFGEDEAEALLHAVDAIEEAIAARIAHREDIPQPTPAEDGEPVVYVSAQVAMKATLWRTMRDGRVRKADLARRLGWHAPQVNRLLDVQHASRIDQFDAAFAALGKRISAVSLDDAA